MDLGPNLAKLALLLPLMCGLIVAGLWVGKRFGLGTTTGTNVGSDLGCRLGLGNGLGLGLGGKFAKALARHSAPPQPRAARVTQTLMLGPGARLAVVEFADRRLLLALGKGGIITLADTPLAATPLAASTALRPLRAADAR